MGYSPWGHKESDTTKVTERAHTGSQLTMLWWFQVNSEGTQPYIHMHPFPPDYPPIQATT